MIKTKSISTVELKRLLVDLKEKRPDIGIRFRIIGELWQTNFSYVSVVTEQGVIVRDEAKERSLTIKDLKQVIQFEIDSPFQNFQPYNHYEVSPYSFY